MLQSRSWEKGNKHLQQMIWVWVLVLQSWFGAFLYSSIWLVVCYNFHIFVCFIVTASGPLRCEINNGGCWKKMQNGRAYSACVVSFSCTNVLNCCYSSTPAQNPKWNSNSNSNRWWHSSNWSYSPIGIQNDSTKGCKCPPGFKGDGANNCEGTCCPLIFFISVLENDDRFKVFFFTPWSHSFFFFFLSVITQNT